MASEASHVDAANRTQITIEYLLRERDTHSPWIATTAFYKALHVVEAVFANDRAVMHTHDHDERASRLKSIRKYQHIATHYFPLSRASSIARYLPKRNSFDDYMSPDRVENELLKHYLHQVEQSAKKFLSDPTALREIGQAFVNQSIGDASP